MSNRAAITANRRSFVKGAGAVGTVGVAGCLGSVSGGSEFPQDGMDLILMIPFSAGGGSDTVLRGISPYVGKYFSETQDVNVNPIPRNVTGGGGTRAINEQFNNDPGGESICNFLGSFHPIREVLELGGVEFETLEFVQTAIIEDPTASIVTRNNVDVAGWEDIRARGESQGGFKVATSGVGNPGHVAFEIISEETGIPANYVHFEGIAPAMNAVIRGEAEYAVPITGSAFPFIGDKPEDLNYVIVLSDQEPPIDIPETPLASDEGVPQWELIVNLTANPKYMVLPPGTSDDIADIWAEVLTMSASDEEFLSWAAANRRAIVSRGRSEAQEAIEGQFNAIQDRKDFLQQMIT